MRRTGERVFGLRRQSAAATALSEAPGIAVGLHALSAGESGVALRFPPQSKTRPVGLGEPTFPSPELYPAAHNRFSS